VIPRAEPLLTKREIAAHYRVSPRTVERLNLPFQKVGRQNRYRVSQCDRVLSGRDVAVPDNVVELRPRKGAA
jgi:hypothetical protein